MIHSAKNGNVAKLERVLQQGMDPNEAESANCRSETRFRIQQ